MNIGITYNDWCEGCTLAITLSKTKTNTSNDGKFCVLKDQHCLHISHTETPTGNQSLILFQYISVGT